MLYASVCVRCVRLLSCVETDEPIEMPLGLWTWVGPRNHVLGMYWVGARIPRGKVVILEVGKRPGSANFRQIL